MKNGIRFAIFTLATVVITVIGTLSLRSVAQWLGEGNRPTEDAIFHLHPVTLSNIVEQDQWLLNFDVFLAPVQKVRSDSSYGLLVVMPKRDQMVHPSVGEHGFVLSGYEPNDEKPLSIDGTYLAQNPGKPEIILLDFLTWSHNFQGKTLTLRSRRD
jgi:hypothetical protein